MRRRLTEHRRPVPAVGAGRRPRPSLQAFGDEVGWPVVVKTPRGGYDGKGVRVVASADEAADWLEVVARHAAAGEGLLAEGLLAEERVDFVRELAVLIARSPSGQADGVAGRGDRADRRHLHRGAGPRAGPGRRPRRPGDRGGLRIAGELGVTGVMAVELFEVSDPRTGRRRRTSSTSWPCARTTAVTGASTARSRASSSSTCVPCSTCRWATRRPREPWTVMGNVLGGDYPELYPAYRHLLARDPGLKMHLYGKGVRPGPQDRPRQRQRGRPRPSCAPARSTPPTTCREWSPNERTGRRRGDGQRQRLARDGGRRAGPRRVRHRLRGRRRVGAPHAAGDGRVRRVGGRPRAAGDHRRRRRRGAPAGHARRRSRRCRSSGCRCR